MDDVQRAQRELIGWARERGPFTLEQLPPLDDYPADTRAYAIVGLLNTQQFWGDRKRIQGHRVLRYGRAPRRKVRR